MACAGLLATCAVTVAEIDVTAATRIGTATVFLGLPLGLALAHALYTRPAPQALRLTWAWHRLRAIVALESPRANAATVVAHAVL